MYIPLFIHSEYSLLASTIKVKELVEYACKLQIPALALTDSHNLFAAVEFSITCIKKNIKPIIATRMRLTGNREILVYVKNSIGYENLSYLISQSYLKNSTEPEVTWEKLSKKTEGLIFIAAPSILAAKNLEDLQVCGENLNHCQAEWYVGLDLDYISEADYLSSAFQKQVVAINESRFLLPEHLKAHDALLCIKNKNYVIQEDRAKSDKKFCFLTPEMAERKFAEWPFALKNSMLLANKCDFFLKPADPKPPRFKTSGLSEAEVLTRESLEGLSKMNISEDKLSIYKERIQYELSVINSMNFSGYFLIVSDFVKYAKLNGIPVSLRGSGAGSLVARCIDITDIDPIQFDLFFERFLNPGRISMPDFDIDFSPTGREQVIKYVSEKYGAQCVAGIITFGSLASRAVLKDVGRVLQVPYSKTDELSKKIQVLFGRPFTLEETYQRDKDFAGIIDADEALNKVFRIGKQLEGLSRHVSVHAAGIIISDGPLFRYSPLYKDESSHIPLTQYSMKYVELIGLIKFDFLGVTALEIIAQTVVKAAKDGIKIDLSNIPFDDAATFSFLRDGHTRGVFQFETSGMTNLIREMEASCIEDLIATVALYRPGPMDNIPTFIRYKKGIEKVNYIYPDLENILKNTYGIIVYQEQILKIVQVIAGYTLSEADLLRRAIGKKILSEMESHKKDFIERAHKLQGGDITKAEALFKLIETFANYGFNKAHAVAYAIVGYRGAYLKTHYCLYFLCISMTAEQNTPGKVAELINEARIMKITILPPCINHSEEDFTIEGDAIRYSLLGIKNVGNHAIDLIIKYRPFKSIKDLHAKINLNKREIEALVKSGALDCFGINRGILLQTWFILAEQASQLLFEPEFFVSESMVWSELEELNNQKEILGIYLEKNPVELYPVKNLNYELLSRDEIEMNSNNIVCVLDSFEIKMSKNNKRFYVCHFSDSIGSWEGMFIPENGSADLKIFENKVITCNVKRHNGRNIIKDLCIIEDRMSQVKNLYIKVQSEVDLIKLREILTPFKVPDGICVYLSVEELIHVGFISNIMSVYCLLSEYEWRAR